jgi:hypothetical protein
MSEPSSPESPRDSGLPPRFSGGMPPPAGGQPSRPKAPDQSWKLVALAVAFVILAVALWIYLSSPKVEQSPAPVEDEGAVVDEQAEEPAPASPPAPMMEEPKPSGHSAGGSDAPALPPLNLLSVGYSPSPASRVVALRIGGALPYFLHEGDSVGAIKILAIMQDRVQISHKNKTYEIRVGSDGKPVGEPKLVR